MALLRFTADILDCHEHTAVSNSILDVSIAFGPGKQQSCDSP